MRANRHRWMILLAGWLSATPVLAIDPTASLRVGSLSLHACEIGKSGAAGGTLPAWCAGLEVPEQWDAPAGRHITLQLALIKSQAAHSEVDVATFLDGGPGGAAREDYVGIAGAFAGVRARHDLLLLDQRGTGGSNVLSCDEIKADADTTAAADASLTLQRVRDCLADVSRHADARFYTTTDAVRDLEAVRQALGSPRLDLIGISYGTRVAQQYTARYPQAVRSVVLDSAVPNTLALGSEHARNLEQSLQGLFARCRAQPACHDAFGDPYATLYRVRQRLQQQAPQVAMRDPVSFAPATVQLSADDLAAVVRFYSYNALTSALLPLVLHEADSGNYAPLLGQKTLLTDDLGGAISGGEELSVVCSEDADLLSPSAQDDSTLLGNDAVRRIQQACSVWPHGARPANFHQPLRSDVPVLLLAGEHDPVTPPAYALSIQRSLPHARVLRANGQGHGVIAAGCMPRLVGEFIDAPTRALDARCLSALGETSFFTSYAGPPP